MSREIKFRVWDKKTNCYDNFNSIKIDGNGVVFDRDYDWQEEVWYDKPDEEHNFVLEQYTGLKDKNGKEIYEGDIVNIQGIKYYVDFEYGGFWFNNDNRKWKANRPFTHFQEINDCEVIGNIHENPELLGGEE